MLQKRNATLDGLLMEKFIREREKGLIVHTADDNTTLSINNVSDT